MLVVVVVVGVGVGEGVGVGVERGAGAVGPFSLEDEGEVGGKGGGANVDTARISNELFVT